MKSFYVIDYLAYLLILIICCVSTQIGQLERRFGLSVSGAPQIKYLITKFFLMAPSSSKIIAVDLFVFLSFR